MDNLTEVTITKVKLNLSSQPLQSKTVNFAHLAKKEKQKKERKKEKRKKKREEKRCQAKREKKENFGGKKAKKK